MDRDTMERTMTDEQIDLWFKEVDRSSAEYKVLLKIIIEDCLNPDTPKIIKDYLVALNDRVDKAAMGD